MRLIAKLYEVEREARELEPQARWLLRQQRSRPVADALHTWLSEQRQKLAKADVTAKAIDYSLSNWRALTRYLRRRKDVVRGTLTIKQHLRIKKFLGTSENAVKTQVWCAVATYVLITIVKKELHLDASLYTCLQILSVSVFEKTQLSCALQLDDSGTELPLVDNQLILFNF